jgi:hypothetical protein
MYTARYLLSIFALLVGTGHITVILVYFLGLFRENKSDYVSDLLKNNVLYMNLMTFFVLLQLTACFGFVRLHAGRSTMTRLAIESMFLVMAWVGWCVLIVQSHSGFSMLHFMGVGLFVGGSVVYFAFLIWELYVATECECTSRVLVVCYVTSVILCALFIFGYMLGWSSAWIFEHSAFTVFSLAHSYMFWVDAGGYEERSGMFDDIQIDLNCSGKI